MKKLFLSIVLCCLASIYSDTYFAQILNSESFDANQFLPTGWSSVGTTQNWARSTTFSAPITGGPHTGNGMARMRFPNNGTGTSVTETIASPVFDLTGRGTNVVPVSFWIYRDSLMPANFDSLVVLVNTTNSLSGAQTLGVIARNRSINIPNTQPVNGWYQYTFNIPPSFAGSSNYILFKGTAYGPSNTARRIYIDDVEWTAFPPVCSGTPTPGTLSAPTTTFCGGIGNTTIALNNPGTGTGISYTWFTSSNLSGPYIALTNTGTAWPTGNLNTTQYYYVQVNCSGSGLSSNTDTLAIVVNTAPLPVVNISMTNDTICQGDNLILSASGAQSYTWSTQQNPNLGTGNTITVNPMNTTTYTLVGTDANGCPSSPTTQTIVVGRKPIINNLNNSNNQLCAGGSSTLTVQATSGVGGPGGGGVTLTYLWNPSGATTASTTVSPAQTTQYFVTVFGQFGCNSTDSTIVSVDPNAVSPTVSLNQDSIDVCQGQGIAFDLIANSPNTSVSYEWSANGQILPETSATLNITPGNQNTIYTVLITDPTNGCTASAVAYLLVHPTPNVNATTTTSTVCLNGSAIVNAQVFGGPGGNNAANTYTWSPGGYTTQLATVTPTIDTYYTVVVTTPFGCTNTDSVQITIDPNQVSPNLSLSASATAMCAGSLIPVDLTATTDALNPSFQWTPNFINQNSPTITINPQNTMNVSVTVTDQNGCTTATGIQILILAAPTASASFESLPNNVVNFTNTSQNGTTYFWDFGDGSTSTDLNPSHIYLSEGTWNVMLVSSNAGCSDTTYFSVNSSMAAINSFENAFRLYPNPVQNELNLDGVAGAKVQILDLTGKILLTTNLINEKSQLDLRALSPGIYVVLIQDASKTVIQQIIKN